MGRLAGKGHLSNPLIGLSSHFEKSRDFNNEMPQNVDNWFTGEDIGFFGGVEYFTPIRNLSLKADYAPIDFAPEQSTNVGFNAPAPWGLSVNYNPWSLMGLSLGTIGAEKFMARLSLQGNIKKWPLDSAPNIAPPDLVSPRALNEQGEAKANLSLNAYQSTAQQVGHAARVLSNQASVDEEEIQISLNHKGLKGPRLSLIRNDFERAINNNNGSAEEIWHDLNFIPNKTSSFSLKNFIKDGHYKEFSLRFILDNQISVSEENAGILYRSSAKAEIEKSFPLGFRLGAAPRVNLADNIGNIRVFRSVNTNTIRGDEDYFAGTRFSLDQLYLSWLHSISQSTHVHLTAGYLEEMFAGYGGEILYRPFKKRFAIGGEIWQTQKRNPLSNLNAAISDDKNLTGHVNLFYEMPNLTTTIYAKAGQYLDEDLGATLGIKNKFKNNSTLEGFITTTNESDQDIFGGNSHLYGGMRFTLPLGSIPFIGKGSEARFAALPFARSTGQILNHPNALYDVTEPIAYREISGNWTDLLH